MKNALIGIELGLALRKLTDVMKLKIPKGDLGFLCPECEKPVKPFVDGEQGPHFEHLIRNPACPLSPN